jgi:hypothetical protein
VEERGGTPARFYFKFSGWTENPPRADTHAKKALMFLLAEARPVISVWGVREISSGIKNG